MEQKPTTQKLHPYFVLPVVVVLDEVKYEVEDIFGTQVLYISQQRHGNWHRLTGQTPEKRVQICSRVIEHEWSTPYAGTFCRK